MIFENTFDNLTQEQTELLNSYFDGYDYRSSSHTLLANYIWRNTHSISWQLIGEYLCIGALGEPEEGNGQRYLMSFPLTRTGSYDTDALRQTLLTAKAMFDEQGQPLLMMVPGSLVGYLSECFPEGSEGSEPQAVIEHDRDDDDYIYLKDELATLSGRKLHQKKNHLNYFLKNYEFTYEEATTENADEIMAYIESKNEYKLGETPEDWKEILEKETEAIRELLKFVGKGLLSGVIRIDGKIVAVTLGEFARTNSKETVIVHVEKADDRIRGLYQAINNEFCKRLPEETVYVNREEDMGLENLRQTKLSYKPVEMGEKYFAVIK